MIAGEREIIQKTVNDLVRSASRKGVLVTVLRQLRVGPSIERLEGSVVINTRDYTMHFVTSIATVTVQLAQVVQVQTVEEDTWEVFPKHWAKQLTAEEGDRLIRVTHRQSDMKCAMLGFLADSRACRRDFRITLRILRSKAKRSRHLDTVSEVSEGDASLPAQ